MKKILLIRAFLILIVGFAMQVRGQEKEIYIPREILNQDFENPESNWCRQRMLLTPNFTILWEKGFGNDPKNAPSLNEKDMSCDLDRLAQVAEDVYRMYRFELKFVGDDSKCDRYRMLIFMRYSDDRTAWGGSRDNEIGALWLSPLHSRNGTWMVVAHELGHCFQQQIGCDKFPHDYFGHKHGFCEMCSQWGLWQYNINWIEDEHYHFEKYIKYTHKPFFHRELCGCSPYVLQYWGEKYGKTFIGEIYRNGKNGEDVVTVYKRIKQMDQCAFCDELFDAICHTVNLDFKYNWENNREFGIKFGMDISQNGDYWQVPVSACPETYGYNVLNLDIPAPGQTVTIHFEGLLPQTPYVVNHPEKAGWRYGIVMVDGNGESHYGERNSIPFGTLSFTAPKNTTIKKLWLIVMGAPTLHWDMPDNENSNEESIDAQWPYRIKTEYDDDYAYEQINVNVINPGELKSLIERDSRIRTAVSLKISGSLNGTDILWLRNLAGCTYDNSESNGKLRYLDLSDAIIVDGGDRYNNDIELDDTGTHENIFPAHGFQNTKLKAIVLPYSVTSIGRYAFGSCRELEKVEYGNNVEVIEYAAFTFSSLKEINIMNNVKSIEACAFFQMNDLENLYIGNGLETIPRKSFYKCVNLRTILIGESVGNIEEDAFGGCSRLNKILSLNINPQSINNSAFSFETYNNAVLYIPDGTSNLYKQQQGWKQFSHIEEIGYTDIDMVIKKNKDYSTNCYDILGRPIFSPQRLSKGKYIINKKIIISK